MREIKFRAWLKYGKEIVDVEEIDFMNKVINYIYNDYENNRQEIVGAYFENIELMQYTGLKDKNNKEIYEGDIIKFEDCSIDGTKEFYNIGVIEREGKRDELVISQLLFEKTYFTENYMDFIDQTFEVSEIIGNIYENPELIKEAR